MNCDSVLTGGDRRRHRDARSAGLVIGVGQMDTLRPRLDAGDTWKSKRGKRGGASRISADLRTRVDTKRPSCPSGELDQGQILRLAGTLSVSARMRQPRCRFLQSQIAHRGSNTQPVNRPRAARVRGLSLCVNQPSEEQNSTRQVRFRAKNIAHQCSEEEPLAETENHRH